MTIELSPEGLGEISIRISLGADGEVSIEIETDSEQTARVLGRLQDSLEASLRNDGIELESFDVSQQADPDGSDESGDVDTTSDESTEERFEFLPEVEEIDLTAQIDETNEPSTIGPADRPNDLRI